MYTKIIGEKTKKRRKEKCMTQNQLANLAGVSQGTVSCLESGRLKSAPEADVLFRIAEALEVDFEYFFDTAASVSLKKHGNMLLDQDEIIERVPFYHDYKEFTECLTLKTDPQNHKYFARYLNIGFGINSMNDAMFPTLLCGDRVFVSKNTRVRTGRIGVFLLDDRIYIRQLEEIGTRYYLKAINPSFTEMIVKKDGGRPFKMFGEVLFFVRYASESSSYNVYKNYQKTFLSL